MRYILCNNCNYNNCDCHNNCQHNYTPSTPINTKQLKFESHDGKTSPCKTHNVSLQEKEGLTPGTTKIVGKKLYSVFVIIQIPIQISVANNANNYCISILTHFYRIWLKLSGIVRNGQSGIPLFYIFGEKKLKLFKF